MTSLGNARLTNVPIFSGSSSVPTQSVPSATMDRSAVPAVSSIQTINVPPAAAQTTTLAGMTVYQVPTPTTTVIPASAVSISQSGAFVLARQAGQYRAPDGTIMFRNVGSPVPVNWVFISPLSATTTAGTVWNTPSGGVAYALPGSSIPPNWTKNTKIAYDESKAFLVESIIPTAGQDGWYKNQDTGEVKIIKKGETIPSRWRTATVDEIPSGGESQAVAAASGTWDITTTSEHNAKYTESTTFPVMQTVAAIIGVIGAAGVVYVGYLYVMKPQEIKRFIERFDQLKTIVVDGALLAIAISIIIGISFVSYEFWKAYDEAGSVPGALGLMASNIIEVFVKGVVQAAETLFIDAWEAFKEFWSNWHPLNPFS